MTKVPSKVTRAIEALEIRVNGKKKTLQGEKLSYQEIAIRVYEILGVAMLGSHLSGRVWQMKKHEYPAKSAIEDVITARYMCSLGLISIPKGGTFGIHGGFVITSPEVKKTVGRDVGRTRLPLFTCGAMKAKEVLSPSVKREAQRENGDDSGWGDLTGVRTRDQADRLAGMASGGTWERKCLGNGIARRI